MSEEAFVALANSKPLRREFLLKMGRSGFPESEMREALERLRRAVARIDDEIRHSGGPWLLGNRLSLADVAIMPVIVRMDDLRLHGMWSDKPAVARWFAAIQGDAAFRPTYYPGSLLTEKYPHLRARFAR